MSVRVLIVDDHAVVREGIRTVLATAEGITVVAEAASGAEAVRVAAAEAPDVVLLDITMPDMSGLEAVPLLLDAAPGVKVLMLSVHDNAEYVLKAVRAGAHGYVRKDTTPAELRDAVHAVRRGAGFFSPVVAGKLAEALREAAAAEAGTPRGGVDMLTAREREVLAAVARGLLNKQTAHELGISVRTVEAHRDNLVRKLGIRSVAALTRLAVEAGLVEPPAAP